MTSSDFSAPYNIVASKVWAQGAGPMPMMSGYVETLPVGFSEKQPLIEAHVDGVS